MCLYRTIPEHVPYIYQPSFYVHIWSEKLRKEIALDHTREGRVLSLEMRSYKLEIRLRNVGGSSIFFSLQRSRMRLKCFIASAGLTTSALGPKGKRGDLHITNYGRNSGTYGLKRLVEDPGNCIPKTCLGWHPLYITLSNKTVLLNLMRSWRASCS